METSDVNRIYGFDPMDIGLRHRYWWIVEVLDEEDRIAGAKVGDLCVKARDGASNPPDPNAFKKPNYRGTVQDEFDCTYRYYYFAPLVDEH